MGKVIQAFFLKLECVISERSELRLPTKKSGVKPQCSCYITLAISDSLCGSLGNIPEGDPGDRVDQNHRSHSFKVSPDYGTDS